MVDKSKAEKKINVRVVVTADQHRRFKIWAKINHRSMSSQVVSEIDKAVPPTEQND